MVRRLPLVRVDGRLCFFDERLGQLRNVRNPHDFFDLNDFEVLYYRNKVKGIW